MEVMIYIRLHVYVYGILVYGVWFLGSAGDLTDSDKNMIQAATPLIQGTEIGSEDLIRYNKNLCIKKNKKKD